MELCRPNEIERNNTAKEIVKCPTFFSDHELRMNLYSLYVYIEIGGPGGGSSGGMVVLYTNPLITNGTYTIQYGGSITGGTAVKGYYTTNGTYSGGSSRTFTVSSRSTSVSAR